MVHFAKKLSVKAGLVFCSAVRVSTGCYARAERWIEHRLTYKVVQQMAVQSPLFCRSNSNPLLPRRVLGEGRGGVKSGRSGALKPDRLGLSCKANE